MKKDKRKVNISKLISCICFFAVIVALPVITVLSPKESFSEMENRNLESVPKITADSVKSRKYMNKLETYISDHFIGRISWIQTKSTFDIISGKRERNNIYIMKDRLAEKLAEPDYSLIDKSIASINTFSEENDVPVYVMLVPTSAEIYSDQLPYNAEGVSQKNIIDYTYKNLADDVTSINVYSNLMQEKDNYIYYRTDHHWTSFGAYTAYSSAGKKMGYTPVSLNSYDIEHAGSDFYGTFFSKTLYNKVEPDTLDIYHCSSGFPVTEVCVTKEFGTEPEIYESMYFREYLEAKDKYSAFFGTNQPMVTVKSESTGGKLLVIKDSYAHSYIPFLTQHYSEITMIDLRYIQTSYKDVINISDYNQVLFLYNASTFSTDENIKKLSAIK